MKLYFKRIICEVKNLFTKLLCISSKYCWQMGVEVSKTVILLKITLRFRNGKHFFITFEQLNMMKVNRWLILSEFLFVYVDLNALTVLGRTAPTIGTKTRKRFKIISKYITIDFYLDFLNVPFTSEHTVCTFYSTKHIFSI